MPDQLISVLSKNDEEKLKLKKDFESSDYQVLVLNDIETTTKHISDKNPVLIMIDYPTIVSADRTKVIDLFKAIKATRSIVYNVPEDTDRRLAFYELGATRVFDKSYALANISHSVMWLARVLSTADDGKRLYSKGQLEDISLSTLINTLGMENRSGILKIVTENNSGKVYFHDGDLINAEVGFHRGEKAIMHMLFWDRGDFSFSSSQNDVPERTINTSNPGIQIVANMYRNKFKINMEKLGKSVSTLRAQNIGDLTADFEDIDRKFIEYISRPKTLQEVLENPYYTCFETLSLLIRLKEKKFLSIQNVEKDPIDDGGMSDKVNKDIRRKSTLPLLKPGEADILKKNLNLKNKTSFTVLFISTKHNTTNEIINDLGTSIIHTQRNKNYTTVEISLAENLIMQVYILQVHQQIMDTLKLLKQKISGQIFVFGIDEEMDYEYSNYLVRQICAINQAPTTLALSNLDSAKDLMEIKPKIKVPDHVEIIQFDDKDRYRSICKAIISLKPVTIINGKKKSGE